MTLAHWKPFRQELPVQDQFQRFFDDRLFKGFGRMADSFNGNLYPSTDVYETKDSYVFKVEVPGMSKEDIEVKMEDNVLTISGEKKTESEVKEQDCHRIERFSGSFSRSFSLPGDTDSTKINANMKDGILELSIPKSEEKKARTIPISV